MVQPTLVQTNIPSLRPGGTVTEPLRLRYATGQETLQLTGLHLRLCASAAVSRAMEAAGGLALVVTARVHLRGEEGGPGQEFVVAVGTLGIQPANQSADVVRSTSEPNNNNHTHIDTNTTTTTTTTKGMPSSDAVPFSKRLQNALARKARAGDVVGFSSPESFLRLDLRVQTERVRIVFVVQPRVHPGTRHTRKDERGGGGHPAKSDRGSWASVLAGVGVEVVVLGTIARLV